LDLITLIALLIDHLFYKITAALTNSSTFTNKANTSDEVSSSNFNHKRLLSVTLALPGYSWLQFSAKMPGFRYCACPESKRMLLGYGVVKRFVTSGNDRFNHIRKPIQLLQRDWIQLDPENTGLQPQALLAFAFDPQDRMVNSWQDLPNTIFEIPAVLLQQKQAQLGITFTCFTDTGQPDAKTQTLWRFILSNIVENLTTSPLKLQIISNNKPLERIAANPTAPHWLKLVNKAKTYIHKQKLHKVVLTRHIQVQALHAFDPTLIMGHLAIRYPNCTHVAFDMNLEVSKPQNRVLVAASPEHLMIVRAGTVTCEALAGTVPRILAHNSISKHNKALLYSPKSLQEHALVVGHIATILREYCTQVQVPDTPQIMNLRFVHHLQSLITGRLTNVHNLIDLVAHLHPTPAVGGVPTPEALQWLKNYEMHQRGWYTGVIGWMTPNGDGEFTVLLRCAILNGMQANLFAGAGIVAGSDPVAELEETELKLQTMLEVLQDV